MRSRTVNIKLLKTEAPKYKDKDGAVEHYQKLRDPINITLDEKPKKIELQVENNKSVGLFQQQVVWYNSLHSSGPYTNGGSDIYFL